MKCVGLTRMQNHQEQIRAPSAPLGVKKSP